MAQWRVWFGYALRVVVIASIAGSVATDAFAQDTTGTISGRLIDAQGLSLPGVTVTAAGPQGEKTVVTDTAGRFSVPFLTPGLYLVHAALQGFNAVDRNDVQVRLGQTVELSLTMGGGHRHGNSSSERQTTDARISALPAYRVSFRGAVPHATAAQGRPAV